MKRLAFAVLIFLILKPITPLNRCPSVDEPSTLKRFKAKDYAKTFCEKFDRVTILWPRKKEDIEKNNLAEKCISIIKPYFKDVKESSGTIEEYTSVCKSIMRENADHCGYSMIHFENLCYDMKSAVELLKSIGSSTYIQIGGYRNIGLRSEDLNDLKFGKIDPLTCLAEMKENYPIKVKQIQSYRNWWQTHQSSECSCTEVLGLNKIFNKQIGFNNRNEHHITITDYFNEICQNKYPKRNVWNSKHFDAITAENKKVDLKEIKTFLFQVTSIAESGWFDDSNYDSQWTFGYLREIIQLKPNSVSLDSVDLASYALRVGVSMEQYKTFLKITSDSEFKLANCRKNILTAIFDVSKYTGEFWKRNYFRNENFYGRGRINAFNDHLNLLIDLFSGSKPGDKKCAHFVVILKTFTSILYNTIWDEDSITVILSLGKQKHYSVYDVVNCIKLSEAVEKSINNLNLLKPKMYTNGTNKVLDVNNSNLTTDGYVLQFTIFRKNLFQYSEADSKKICDKDSINRIQDKINLLKLLNNVFNLNKEYKEVNKMFKEVELNYYSN